MEHYYNPPPCRDFEHSQLPRRSAAISSPLSQPAETLADVYDLYKLTSTVLKLPRELRDLIYSYIWNGGRFLSLPPIRHRSAHNGYEDVVYLDPLKIPNFLKHGCGFVPRAFVCEAIDYLYSHLQIPFCDAGLIDAISWDMFDTGLRLEDYRLPKLVINLDLAEIPLDLATDLEKWLTDAKFKEGSELTVHVTSSTLPANLDDLYDPDSYVMKGTQKPSYHLRGLYTVFLEIKPVLDLLVSLGLGLKVLYSRYNFVNQDVTQAILETVKLESWGISFDGDGKMVWEGLWHLLRYTRMQRDEIFARTGQLGSSPPFFSDLQRLSKLKRFLRDEIQEVENMHNERQVT